jgi:DNA-binding NtrC family response regulator
VSLPMELPPLRDRDNDVIILAKHFIDEFVKSNKTTSFVLSETAKTKLRKYTWPGNVRELKAVIDLACVMADGKEIKAEDLSFYQLGDAKPYSSAEKTLKEFEIEIIESYLKKYDENVVFVAEKLDIGKSKIYNMIKSGEIKLKK